MHKLHSHLPSSIFYLLSYFLLASLSAQEIRRAIPVKPIFAGYNEDALFLAGKDVPENSSLAPLQRSNIYQEHAASLQKLWSLYEQRQFVPMREWSLQELPSRIPLPSVVCYFFSGPDILNPLALFPDAASTYLLCGKESIGAVTPPEQLSPEELQSALASLREAMKTALQFGFFITKEMRSQTASGPFQGVLPLFLTFLNLTENRILSVERLTLGGAPGLRIDFVAPSGAEKTLYYAQQDLSNESCRSFLRWLQQFMPAISYLKAASYLLYEENFSRTRNFLLQNCNAILQDDSGIPFRCFDNTHWTLYLFGDYKGPIELFRTKYQADLANAYHTSLLAAPMEFGTGYQFQPGLSGGANLLLAVRQEFAPRAVPVNSSRYKRSKKKHP
ncbi:MAG: hypothetical protein FJ390_00555 [Verrucomicrobia bacterium]|nr:hypothetical protein [Verrucomicrobiota bacterium]